MQLNRPEHIMRRCGVCKLVLDDWISVLCKLTTRECGVIMRPIAFVSVCVCVCARVCLCVCPVRALTIKSLELKLHFGTHYTDRHLQNIQLLRS